MAPKTTEPSALALNVQSRIALALRHALSAASLLQDVQDEDSVSLAADDLRRAAAICNNILDDEEWRSALGK